MRIPPYASFGDQNLYQDDLNQEMQANLSDNGLVTPSQPTDTIASLATTMPDGTNWYDNETHQAKILVNGVLCYIPVVPV